MLANFVTLAAAIGKDASLILPAGQATPELIAQAEAQIQAYWSVPWALSLLGAVERFFTIPFHLACSLLVMQVFTRKQARWLWLAVAWHALADAVGPGLLNAAWRDQPWGAYAIEGVIGLFALASLGIIFALRQPEPQPEATPDLPPIQPIPIPIVEIQPEDLEQSRFS